MLVKQNHCFGYPQLLLILYHNTIEFLIVFLWPVTENHLALYIYSDVVDDTTPQLGGNLDTNSFMVDFDDDHGIRDENGNEQLQFQTTASAVNHFDITNAATGNSPTISAVGGDTNIDLTLVPKGSGVGKLTNANGTSSTQQITTDGKGIVFSMIFG